MTILPVPPLPELDIKRALKQEIEHAPDLLPKSLVDRALERHVDAAADHLGQLAHAGLDVHPASVVAARKWRHGRRPVAVLPIFERVLYRSVVNSLSDDLEEAARGQEVYDSFQRAPLSDDSTAFVVMTDIANYYSSINLDLLARDLVHRTGRWKPVDWLRQFWTATSGGFGGIPQMNPSSDVVADAFADQLLRALLRSGYRAWRYADDFRIACKTYSECVAALELLDEESRRLGLFMNERKTFTPRRTRYREIVEGPERQLNEISNEVEQDLTEFDPYSSSEPVLPEKAQVLELAAVQAIEAWSAKHGQADADPPQTKSPDLAVVLPKALAILGVTENSEVLMHIPSILRFEPQLTPNACQYLRLIAGSSAPEVAKVLMRCVNDLALTKWQHIWLLYVLEDGSIPREGAGDGLLTWMRALTTDTSEPLRCQAAWSLACRSDLKLRAWKSIFESGSRLSSPYAAAAIVGTTGLGEKERQKLAPTDRIDRLVTEWARTSGHIMPF